MAEITERMQKDQNGQKGRWSWLTRGILVSLLFAVIFTSLFDFFQSEVEQHSTDIRETDKNISWLYQNTYLLYRELYNVKNQLHADYSEIYLDLGQMQWMTDQNARDWYEEYGDIGGYISRNGVTYNVTYVDWNTYDNLIDRLVWFEGAFQKLERDFDLLTRTYGYIIRDHQSDHYVTNLSDEELAGLSEDSFFLLSFVFDSAGNVSVGEDIKGNDVVTLRKMADQATKMILQFDRTFGVSGPVDCTVTYAVSKEQWEKSDAFAYTLIWIETSFDTSYNHGYFGYYTVERGEYHVLGLYAQQAEGYLLSFMALVFLFGIFMPVRTHRPWAERRLFNLPLEALLTLSGILMGGIYITCMEVVQYTASGQSAVEMGKVLDKVLDNAYNYHLAEAAALGKSVLFFTLYFLCIWGIGVSVRPLRELGWKRYLREHSLICRFFRYVKAKVKDLYQYFLHMDLSERNAAAIRRLVIVNALILSVISLTWLGGLGITVIYSFVLYFLLRKYVNDLQKRYGILLKAVDQMAEGNLNVTIKEDLGVFEPFKPQVIKIQEGFRKAVDEEVKSQRMRAELITNVSHDLKTPLTAIITYVNLLKDPGLTEEQRQEYLDTLERKSMRLKVLIEDLFEVSKANTGNVTLNLMPIDIMSLIKQVSFEMKDKLDGAELDLRMNLTDEKLILNLDSQKTYRIYENLFSNVAKYALRGTRVYVNGFRIDDTIVITMKNISAQELTVDAADLTERFVRGDVSRNTEGSGLGLAIAKSFTELQGGQFELEVDGDLFKVTTVWKV